MNRDNFLELHNISKRFHGVQALKDVDFELRRGEIHCIVGENGSGKSTLIKIISGVCPPEPGGTLIIDGVSQSDITPAKSTHLGIQVIYQDHSLFPNLTVTENIGIHQHLEAGRHFVNWKKLRETALEAMDFLESFHPKLVGPVLEGTADQHSRVSLHVFSEVPDEVSLFLTENGIPYREESRRIRWHTGKHRDLVLLITEAGEVTVELCLFQTIDLRQPPPGPVDGRPQKRASRHEVHLLQMENALLA